MLGESPSGSCLNDDLDGQHIMLVDHMIGVVPRFKNSCPTDWLVFHTFITISFRIQKSSTRSAEDFGDKLVILGPQGAGVQ